MPKVTDTYERAYAACTTLAARGINPTVKTVAEFIGTNSPAIISPAIKDWRQSVAVESLQRLSIPEVPERLVEATVMLWRMAVEEAQAALAKEKQAIAAEQAEFKAQAARAEAALQALQQASAAYREQATQDLAALRLALQQQQDESKQAQAALAQARETQAGLAASLEETQRQLARETAAWEEKFDRDHAWHLSRIAEERERARLAGEDNAARLEEALQVSRQQVASLNGYLDQSAAATGELRGELKAMREERGRLLQDVEAMRETAQQAAARNLELEKQALGLRAERDRLQAETLKLQAAAQERVKAPPRKPNAAR